MVALAPLDPAPCYQCALCGHTLSGAEVGATIDWATQEASSCLQVSHITLSTHASYHLLFRMPAWSCVRRLCTTWANTCTLAITL